MFILNLYRFVCMPCLRVIATMAPKHFHSTKLFRSSVEPVPLAYSEYLEESPNVITDSPIMILHGLLASRENWKVIAKNIAVTTHRKVVTIDLRNHGDSPHTDEFSYAHLTADIKRSMQEQKIEEGKASIIGHSLGGRIAMALALEQPQVFRDLIIIDISPTRVPPGMSQADKLLDAIISVKLQPHQSLTNARQEANEQMKRFIRGEKLRQFLLKNLTLDEKAEKFEWKVNAQSLKDNLQTIAIFPKAKNVFDRPCLFVASKESQYLKPADENDIKKLFPKANFLYITGAGHFIYAGNTDEFIQNITLFLNNNLLSNYQ